MVCRGMGFAQQMEFGSLGRTAVRRDCTDIAMNPHSVEIPCVVSQGAVCACAGQVLVAATACGIAAFAVRGAATRLQNALQFGSTYVASLTSSMFRY